MALLEFGRGGVGQHAYRPERARVAETERSTLRKAALELVGTFLALVGIAIGILTILSALFLMHGVLR
jgi:hypothetical protein